MKRQRSMFFGKKPRRTPKKDGANPPVPERRRAAMSVRDLDVRFDNDTATQFGGYPLRHAYATEIGLDAKLAQRLKLARGPNAFTAPEAGRFLVDLKILGFDRLMHAESARLDPMLVACAGIEGLPGGKTLGNFLKEHTSAHVEALDRLNARFNAEAAKLGLHYDRLPCAELTANRAYLQYVAMAYNLGIHPAKAGRRRAPRTVNRWTVETVRTRLLVLCGNLRRRAKRWVLSLPNWWRYRTVFRQIGRTALPAPAT